LKIKKGTLINNIVMIVTVIAAFILGKFFGFSGIGTAIIGWFAYDYSRKKLGTFLGIIIGFTADLVTYGLAAFGLMSMLK
tara:strand:- start:552 stop:791 length:240 start_codon:yes stop_codon:yes gene_type:complete